MLDQARTIDNRGFMDEILTVLTEREPAELETHVCIVMGLD